MAHITLTFQITIMIIDFVQINKQLGKRYAMSFQYASMSVEARSLLKILTKSLAYKYPPPWGVGGDSHGRCQTGKDYFMIRFG
jgi:hypothetical protein